MSRKSITGFSPFSVTQRKNKSILQLNHRFSREGAELIEQTVKMAGKKLTRAKIRRITVTERYSKCEDISLFSSSFFPYPKICP